jgi:hypothetical protein
MSQTYVIRSLRRTGKPTIDVEPTRRLSAAVVQVLAMGAAFDGAVYEVGANDLRLTEGEINERLLASQLRSTDLIRVNGAWLPLAEYVPVGDAAAVAARRERRLRALRSIGLALLTTIAFCLYMAFRFAIGR